VSHCGGCCGIHDVILVRDFAHVNYLCAYL
jgi:hypothetical protein